MLKRASLAVAAALLVTALAGRAEAVVMIDPGPVGGPSNSPLVSEALFPGGQTTSFHYVFEDMKHVEVTTWGWLLPDDFDPGASFAVEWVFYLTDMFGNEIPATRASGDEIEPQGFLRSSSAAPIIAHDFFIEMTPIFDSTVPLNLPVNIIVDGIVGEWVALPEPAAITLFGFGLLGLGFAGRHGAGRRRKKIAG